MLIRVDRAPETRSGHPRHIHPSLPLKYIQAAVEREIGVKAPLLDGWLHPWSPTDLIEAARSHDPWIAVIAASSTCIDEALAVGHALRREGILTVAVGQQVTHATHRAPRGWSRAFDFSILGEPEQETVLLLQRLLAGESREALARHYEELFDRREAFSVLDPDALPMPTFDPEERVEYPFPFPVAHHRVRRWGYVLTSWGCPHACTHCTGVLRKTTGAVLRKRTPSRVVDEVELLLAGGAQGIIFEDDTFFCDPGHLLAICAEIGRRGLRFPWIAHARADDLVKETVSAARQAGAVLLKIGVESGSRRVIERLGKTSHADAWADDVERGFGLLHQHGIGSVAMFMVGCPDENERDVERSIELALRLDADYLQVQIFCPYPDIRLLGRLDSPPTVTERTANQYHYAAPSWNLSHIPLERLRPPQAEFYRRFYLRPGFVLRHLRRHWRHYVRPGGDVMSNVSKAARIARSS